MKERGTVDESERRSCFLHLLTWKILLIGDQGKLFDLL